MDSDSFKRTQSFGYRYRIPVLLVLGCIGILLYFIFSTSGGDSRSAKVGTQDSMPFMHSVGVSSLISDSGVIRYHLVAEEWDIHTPASQAATWKFMKGMLMLRLDENFDVDLYVQADTAYLHNQKLWELRGRVRIRNVQGTRFNTEELYWDLNKHEMWNHTHMTVITPERTLEGTEFRSNEDMTRYSVANSKGDFPVSDAEGENQVSQGDSIANADSADVSNDAQVQAKSASDETKTFTVLPPAPTKYDFKKKK